MTKTLIKSRYKKYRPKLKSQQNDNKTLPLELQNFKNKLLSGSGFIVYK